MVSCNCNQREEAEREREKIRDFEWEELFSKEADPLVYLAATNPNTKTHTHTHTTAVLDVKFMTLG